MRILIDVNLSPKWQAYLQAEGHDAVHWSNVGDIRATDAEIMAWARANDSIVFTHDLDFTTILAMTRAIGPSVVQLRTQDTLPDAVGPSVSHVLAQHGPALETGAVVSIDEAAARVRVLPLR